MGAKFDEYTSSGYIVGEESSLSSSAVATEDEYEAKNIEMASNQNKSEDTSCAIVDDDLVWLSFPSSMRQTERYKHAQTFKRTQRQERLSVSVSLQGRAGKDSREK